MRKNSTQAQRSCRCSRHVRSVLGALLAIPFLSQFALAGIVVRLEPTTMFVDIGSAFDVAIVADIPNPVIAWGVDLAIADGVILSHIGEPTIGPSWIATNAADSDGLAAVAFPNGVSGTSVLLATVSFTANAVGETALLLAVTPGDPTEGFGLDPVGFAEVTFEPGHVTVVPDPTTLSLLACGSLALLLRRR